MRWFKSAPERVYFGNKLSIDVSGKFKFTFGIATEGEQRGYIKGHATAIFRLNGELHKVPIFLYGHVGTYKDLEEGYGKILQTDRSVIMKALQDDVIDSINRHFKTSNDTNAKVTFEKHNKEFSLNFNMTASESDIKK